MNTAPARGGNRAVGEGMEPAIKHTYICGSDEWISEKTEVSIAPRSFAQGGMRKCHKCIEKCVEGSKVYSVESVAKFSMIHRDARSARTAAFADAKMQMVAEYWAQQFNIKSPPEHKVSFVVAQVLELPSRPDGPQRWSSLEPLLAGEYAKFNNNAGAVLGGRVAQAFSHFTVHESSSQLCICDLQGVGGSLFTDPQIHSTSGSYGDGNLGRNGINSFLSTHRCNEVCASLGLPLVESRHRSSGGPGIGNGGKAGLMGGEDWHKMMRGGMVGGGAGMTMPMQRIMEQMMQQLMRGHVADPGARMGNVKVFVNGHPVNGEMRGGHRPGGARVAGGGELQAALQASEKVAAEEEERNLRAALAISGGARGERRGQGGRSGGGAREGGGGAADSDLYAAMRASEKTAAEEEERNVRAALACSGRRR